MIPITVVKEAPRANAMASHRATGYNHWHNQPLQRMLQNFAIRAVVESSIFGVDATLVPCEDCR